MNAADAEVAQGVREHGLQMAPIRNDGIVKCRQALLQTQWTTHRISIFEHRANLCFDVMLAALSF